MKLSEALKKATPRPWEALHESDDQYEGTEEWCDYIIEGDSLVLAHINSDVMGKAQANAELIRRAPMLKEAVELLTEYLEWRAMTGSNRDLWKNQFRDFLKRLEGE